MAVSEIILAIIGGFLIIVIAPLYDGIIRKLVARLQSRQGPPITQSYRDILKLASKSEEYIPEYSTVFYRLFPILYLCVIMVLAILIPVFISVALPPSDIIVIIYLLLFTRFMMALASFDATNPYAVLGISREFAVNILAESTLLLAAFTMSVMPETGTTALPRIIDNVISSSTSVLSSPAYYLAALSFCLAALVETGMIPFDIGEAEQELSGGLLVEYGGRSLALLKLSIMTRRLLVLLLFIDLFIPWGIATSVTASGLLMGLLLTILKLTILVMVMLAIAISSARFRLFDLTKLLGISLLLGFLALLVSTGV